MIIAKPNSIILTEVLKIDDDCFGERWVAIDRPQLAKLIAIMLMGQTEVAAHILATLDNSTPLISIDELRNEAKIKLTVEEPKREPRGGYPRTQRDGLIFESISWLAAKQQNPGALLKDPHTSATMQGLDGLMIELNDGLDAVTRTTVFEDKCTDDARGTFRYTVLPEFVKRHANTRCAEMISAATTLIRIAGVSGVQATMIAAEVTNKKSRRYRASFAVTEDSDSDRKALFANYNIIADVNADQRIGACLIVPLNMRDWFEELAHEARTFIDSLNGVIVV